MRFVISLLFTFTSFILFAQEELVPLSFNSELQDQIAISNQRDEVQKGEFIYLVDTLELPFFDDFTKNKIKRYNAQKSDQNITLRLRTDFSVNGDIPAILEYMVSPTYSYTKQTNGSVDSTINPQLIITNYDTAGEVLNMDTGYTNVISTTNLSSGIITLDTLSPDRIIYNTFDTTFVVLDDPFTLWVTPVDDIGNQGAYINNRFVKYPLTQGVATFDGTDAKGFPYDASSETTYGIADMLESKPLRIDSNMQNVFLSFFYMKGGIGNAPDESDSLVLEYYNVRDNQWEYKWSVSGDGLTDSIWEDQVILDVSGNKFLREGFKFRFLNYGTLSGAFDHWHIDYVRMNEDLDTNSLDTIRDISFLHGFDSYFDEYTSVPYSHYLASPLTFQAETNSMIVRNLNILDSVFLDALTFELKDKSENVILSNTSVIPAFSANTIAINEFNLPESQIFPDLSTDRVEFETTCTFKVTGGNLETINDTISSSQEMWDYYSYDDGTAENAYALTGAGLELAYQFDTPIKDTLKSIHFNFPQMLHEDNEDLSFSIAIYSNLESTPIYEDVGTRTPQYTRGNEFARYDLQEDVVVDGTFYVGFKQIDATKIYIGFDKNKNAQNKLAYRATGDVWKQSRFPGALMVRPEFGIGNVLSVNELSNKDVSTLNVYPNPSNGYLNFEGITEPTEIEVYSTTGVLVHKSVIGTHTTVNLTALPNGIYLLKGVGQTSGVMHAGKVMITQ